MTGFIALFLVIALSVTSTIGFRCPTQGVYAHYNPNYFYFCDRSNVQAELTSCAFGQGFLQTDTATGCVSYDEWECTAKTGINAPHCDKPNVEIPHLNPNMFWKCVGYTPEIRLCPEGKGYKEGSGCIDWTRWYCVDRVF